MRSSWNHRLWTLSGSIAQGLWSSFSLLSSSNHAYAVYRGHHNASLLLSLPVPYLVVLSWELQGDQSPLLPCSMAIPGELVLPSNESGQGSAIQSWNAGPKQNPGYHQVAHLLIRLGVSPLQTAEPPVWWLKGPAWLESHWVLQKCCRNQ